MIQDELLERIRFRGNPVADPESIVVAGNARFTLLTARLIRLEWSETVQFNDRPTYAFPARLAPVPAHQISHFGTTLQIDTSALALRYQPENGCFGPKSLSAVSTLPGSGEGQVWCGQGRAATLMHPWARGWRPGQPGHGNLRGTRRTLDGCEGDATLEDGLLSQSGWAVFDDSRSVRFDPVDGWVAPPPSQPYQDWYLFAYGHDYKAALADYTRFGGPIPLIPRFVLGAWWSRYWAYSDQDLKQLIGEFERHGFPLDVLVIDMDWHTPHAWTGYTWNRELFPDPPAFLQWVHDKGLHVTLNLHPAQGVQPFEEIYPRFARSVGVNPDSGQPVPFRASDKAFVKSYFELLHHPLEDQGIDFWWVDWQQGDASEMEGLDPLPWLNHMHFSDSRRRGRRPLLYSRWGGLGNHRYPIGFSGDTYVTWSALQFQPYLTATASNVVYGWWSHDIGGHMGGATDPELYARWVQFGALSPVLRLHATKDPRAERRPWSYPHAVCHAARAAFQLRYQLIPYLYTMARMASDTGISLCRPMYYEHPEHEAAYVARNQYYLGDQLIAAPIVHPANPKTGFASTDVWVPPGMWIDFFTLETFTGPGWVRILGGLDRMPLLVRSGGVVPLAGTFLPQPSPVLSPGTSGAIPSDRITLAIFPGEQGALRLYEDDGTTEAYLDGHYEWTPITTRMESPKVWEVRIAPAEGRCDALQRERSIEIRLVGSRKPDSVTLDGVTVPLWSYDPDSLATTIPIPKRDRHSPLVIAVHASHGMVALGDEHNRRLVRSDVLRLLGSRCGPFPDHLTDAELLETALRADSPGQADAIARLGGPFLRLIEYGGLDQAQQCLGRIIVMAPRLAGESFDVNARFDLETHTSQSLPVSDHVISRIPMATETQIVEGPPAPLHPIRAGRWSADACVTWRGTTLTCHHQSPPLFPTIYAWQGLTFDENVGLLAWQQVLDPEGCPRSGLDWETFPQTLDGLINIYQPHILYLSRRYAAELKAGNALAGYLVTAVTSPEEREAVLQFRSPGPVDVLLNGQAVAVVPGEYEGTIHPRLRPTRRTEPLHLRLGENYLAVRTRPQPGAGHPWVFGGALTSPRSEVLIDLGYRLPCLP